MAKFYKRNPKNAESFLFRGLTRLLSGPITNYRRQNPRQLKRLQLDKFKFKSASNQPFKKAVSSPLAQIYANSRGNVNRAERYIDFDQMEFCAEIACLEGNTRIMCLEGIFTISELCDKYKNNETFEIWAWDNEKNKYTIGQAHNPRKTGTKEVIKVWFDNGNFLECTPEHRILMIDGTYKEAQQLNNLDAVMPFEFQKREYLRIRKPNGKYKSAHRYIFEDVFERQINSINVHHKNHRKYDNRTDNLELLNALDHARLHGKSTITTEKISKSCRQHWNDLNDDEKKERISGFTRWQSSLEGKKFMSDHASFLNKERWKNDLLYVSKMTQIFSNHARSLWENEDWALWKRNHHSETLKLKFANDPSYKDRIKHIRSENGRFEKSVTNEMVLLEGLNYKTLKEFADGFNFDTKTFKHYNGKVQFLQRRLRSCGFKSWEDYKTNYKYSNHKVEHIEWTGKICDVYDLTVDHFENFCLESGIIVSNSSLDIYADEMTTSSPIQKLLTIKCPNEEIKSVLENLYYNVLNLEFNLFGWCRDTCKYGDKILYLDIDEEHGITNFVGLPLMEIERIEGEDKTNPNYVQFQWNSAGMTFENWQVAHFRILGNDKFAPYGNSILDPVRRIWRQLDLQEQAMMAYRIVRCLHGSSKIWTEDGYKEIKDIKVGDKVYSYDNDKLVLSNVLDWVENGIQQIWEIKSKHRTIRTNFNHPILVKDKDTNIIEYVSVDKLIPNKHMFVMPCVSKKESDLFENIVEVSSTEIFDNVYDIRVDNDNHNFISDGVIVHNSPERRVFYVDVGGINEKDVEQHMEKIMTTMKRNTIVDPDSGQADKRFNPMSIEEDYFIPVIGNTGGTRIESLPGGSYTGDIDDVKYLRDKMMSGLKIPHSYIVATEGSMEDKTTLSQKDILFAKTIQRIQRSVVSELEKIGYIHLFVLGYRGKDLISFKLELPNPSKIAELQELEHLKTKFDVAGAATEGYYSRRTIAKKILGMSDEEFLRNTREMFFDAQLAAQLEAIASAGEMAAEGGGDLGDLGGDLGGEEESPEDETLLAAPGKEPEIPPGKRHDFNSMMPQLRTKGHITAGSKGKVYTPVVSDQRSGGARRRSMRGKYSDEMGRNTFRNVFKGGSEMRTLSKGIFEEYEHNYKQTMTDENNKEDNFIAIEAECSESSIEETQQLTDNASSIKLMIESLEKDDSWKEKIKSSKIGNKPDE